MAIDPDSEVLDDMGSDDPRDHTVKRLPIWGDQRDLLAVLDVGMIEPGRYGAASRPDPARPVVEGSQMLAQTMVAAMRHAPGRRPVSASMFFARVVSTEAPYEISLGEVANGRTFTALAPQVTQNGKVCTAGTVLLDVTAPDLIRSEAPAPQVPGPHECEPHDMGITGRDVRFVGDAYRFDEDAPVGPPELDVWIRFRDAVDDEALNVGELVHLAGMFSIGAAMRPHPGIGLGQAHRSISTGVNAISMSIHAPIRAHEWMLYHYDVRFAGNGMTHAACSVHDTAGSILASFSIDAMVRGMLDTGGRDHRTAM